MLSLCADEQCIEIDTTSPNWCKCWLRNGEDVTYLGAESLKYLRDHLLRSFDASPKEGSSSLQGHKVGWILSLAEAHHTLYMSIETDDRVLFWQDKNATVINTTRLSQKEILHWQNQLELLM